MTFVYALSGLAVTVGVLFEVLPREALLVFLLIAAPLLQDCLRYKAFVAKSFAWPLVSDSVWLLFLVCGTIGFKPQGVLLMFALWGGGAFVAAIPLVHVRQSLNGRQFREVLRLGKYQFTEWSLAAFTTTVPLFVMQAVIPLASISAFRLAQTLMGPLNTVTSFVSVKYLLDSASFSKLDRQAIRQRVSKTSWILVGFAAFYGSLVVAGFLLFGHLVDPVLAEQLVYAVPITVIAAIVTSPCTPFLALARSLSLHRATIMPRLQVVLANVFAIGIGIVLWSKLRVDPLVVTSLFTAVVSFLIYRRLFIRVLIGRPREI
ncbi:UNVERIFIED_CONTAM: hypothetical protein RF648_11770 [Kocuria sp. CPCC 205274]